MKKQFILIILLIIYGCSGSDNYIEKLTKSNLDEIIQNLTDKGNNNFESKLNNVTLIFPSDCWKLARESDPNLKFVDLLKKMTTNVYLFLDRLTIDTDLKVKIIHFTGLWRPTGRPPHVQGKALDIGVIYGQGGNQVSYNINSSSTENSYGKKIREKIYNERNQNQISEIFSPWYMCGDYGRLPPRLSTKDCCQINEQIDHLEKEHLNHLHITFK